MSREIFSISTLRADRSRGCQLPTESTLKKQGRGHISEFVDTKNNLVICTWYDNRRLLTLSNYLGKDPVDVAKRYDKKQKEIIQIPRPANVQVYNSFMGGVDKTDMFLALYRTKLRTQKWYRRIAIHVLPLAVVNAFVIYREIGGNGSLFDSW